MRLQKIRIENFKSIYGVQEFDFESLEGLVKLSGAIGSGKTTVSEAIIWGLYGTVKDQKNPDLVSWNTKTCQVDLDLVSKNRKIHITRNIREPLKVEIDGKLLAASSKRNTQEILETEFFDVPKMAIDRMCIISFNMFKGSLANMSPYDTKQFLDNIFGFKTFTQYNDKVVEMRKTETNEAARLNAVYSDVLKQIDYLKEKQARQQQELRNSVDTDGLTEERDALVKQGTELRATVDKMTADYNSQNQELYKKQIESKTLGTQAKNTYNTFRSGKCPTCGHDIEPSDIQKYHDTMMKYASSYKESEAARMALAEKFNKDVAPYNEKINSIKSRCKEIDNIMIVQMNKIKLLADNYDALIADYTKKAEDLKVQISKTETEVSEWNEMNELFTKTLRYNLLETLIPHINNSIQLFINKLDLQFKVSYDQEFKAHIYVDTFDKEISYNNLSTGQKKSLDLAIVFGILQNVIANVEFNVLFLDELFSNLDAESRNLMLSLLNETLVKDRCIFVVNHAEMSDDYFSHKLRVELVNKKIKDASAKKKEDVIVKSSRYVQVF